MHKMLLSAVFCTVLIFSSWAEPAKKLSDDIYRFVFKFYYSLPYEELISALDSQIKNDFSDFSIKDLSLPEFSTSPQAPGNLLRYLESELYRKKIYKNTVSKASSATVANQAFYIAFIQDAKINPESSFGHIALLIDDNSSLYFNSVVSFMAEGFRNPATGKISVKKFFKGGFSKVEGDVFTFRLFDFLYAYIIEQERIVSLYKLNLSSSEKIALLEKINSEKKSGYNFFVKNCSSVIFSALYEIKNEKIKAAFAPPVELLRNAVNRNFLEYSGAFIRKNKSKDEKTGGKYLCTFSAEKKYDLSKSIFYKNISMEFDSRNATSCSAQCELTLFSLNRPFEGYCIQRNNYILGNFNVLYSDEKIEDYKIVPFAFELRPRFFNSALGGIYDFNFYKTKDENRAFCQNAGFYLSVKNLTLKSYLENYSSCKFNTNPYFQLIFSTHWFDLYNLCLLENERLKYQSTKISLIGFRSTEIFGIFEVNKFSAGVKINF